MALPLVKMGHGEVKTQIQFDVLRLKCKGRDAPQIVAYLFQSMFKYVYTCKGF